ncbi:MAG: malate/lactate/ureidoglycolate dehydrogenase [Acidimicrobiia bacterium]|nr:malate/lactate/ureidoglycolate dehydrogenase [Acidimicrobiia bacterium]
MGSTVRIPADRLRQTVSAIFTAAGCRHDEADRIADHLVTANLMGQDGHGVVRTRRYLDALADGTVVAGADLDVVVDGGAFAVVDGNYGFGQTIGPLACRLGIDKARAHGVAVVGLRHSGHLGRIGHYAEMAAEAGQVSIHFVNVASSTLVAPFGAIDRRMGTNPVCIGLPLADRDPIILDFATSVVAEGKALVALDGGTAIPEDALITAGGELSNDPLLLYGHTPAGETPSPYRGEGALRAVGHHKGSGLALMCELLAGALIGSGTAGPPPQRHGNGMLSIYLDLRQFAPDDQAMADILGYVDWFVSARPATPGGEVLVPGQPERRRRAEREASGIDLTEATWSSILDGARSVGLDPTELEARAFS